MTFAASLFLIAVGAILRFATHLHVSGINLRTVGVILIIIGVIGFLIALWQWATWNRRSRQSEVVVDDRRPPDGYRDPRY